MCNMAQSFKHLLHNINKTIKQRSSTMILWYNKGVTPMSMHEKDKCK